MPNPAAIQTPLAHGIVAVDTDYVRPLLDASHLIVENGRAAFVDTGTSYSVPLLLDALRRQDVDAADVDYLFLTHVHLDHAGGAGKLMQHLPNARAVIHPRGVQHMAEPAKLIEGTIAVYGERRFRDIYEDVISIPRQRIAVADNGQRFSLAGRSFQCFFTEGHARHHYCLWDAQSAGIFAGDSFGVSYRELDTANGEFIFPSSTPIDFDPVEAHASIDRIMSYDPEQVFLTHYSRVGDLSRLAADMHAGIDFYVALATRHANDGNRTGAIQSGMFDHYFERLQAHGFSGGIDRAHAVLDFDVELNTKGLDVWLSRNSTKSSRLNKELQ